MIIVTGGTGFVGSHVCRELSSMGRKIIVVDDLEDSRKLLNVSDIPNIIAMVDKTEGPVMIEEACLSGKFLEGIIHLGAISDTTHKDNNEMMATNYGLSVQLMRYAAEARIPFVYASSAAVYGASWDNKEDPGNECPLNVYGYSKLLTDRARNIMSKEYKDTKLIGLRYFNVYGPGEAHKDKMASMVHQIFMRARYGLKVELFAGSDGYRRDFVHVSDVAKATVEAVYSDIKPGVYNIGTGSSRSFSEIACQCHIVAKRSGAVDLQYITMPDNIKNAYQYNTMANLTNMRAAGFLTKFRSLEQGIIDSYGGLFNDRSPEVYSIK